MEINTTANRRLAKKRVQCLNETLYWTFTMNENRNNYEFGNLKPFVHDGLEFSAEMIFKNSKLKTLIYNYQIP